MHIAKGEFFSERKNNDLKKQTTEFLTVVRIHCLHIMHTFGTDCDSKGSRNIKIHGYGRVS